VELRIGGTRSCTALLVVACQIGSVIVAGITVTNPGTMAAPGGHYSHAVRANGFVFISGQLPIAPDGSRLADAPFERQAEQTLHNVEAALTAAGSALDRLVQVRVYVTDIKSWPAFNAIYAKWIGSSRPARAVVPVPELHYGFQIEVEAVALA
jgi:2-iminobutanoate/2-iminopropanoate deaminase